MTQPPGNRSYQVAVYPPVRRSTRWKARTPGRAAGTSTAPVVSQAALSRATTAAGPARSWPRVMTDRPSLTATFATVQPGSVARRHGTMLAEGTAWASSHSGSGRAQLRLSRCSGVLTATSLLSEDTMIAPRGSSSATTTAQSPTRRGLHRWMLIGRGGAGSSLTNSACRSRPFSRISRRSCDGNASPRAAANPSLISSTVNWRSARS